MTTIFDALARENMLTEEQQRLHVAGLLTEDAFEALSAAKDVGGESLLPYILELPSRSLSVEQAVAWLRLGAGAAKSVTEAGGDILAWSAAMSEFAEVLPGILPQVTHPPSRYASFTRLVETVAPLGYTPDRLLEEGRGLLQRGVRVDELWAALRGEKPIPADVLASSPYALTEVFHYEDSKTDLPLHEVHQLVKSGVTQTGWVNYQKAGVASVNDMIELSENGVSAYLAHRFKEEGVARDEWLSFRQFLAPLENVGHILSLGQNTAITLRRMLELLAEGVSVNTVAKWSANHHDSAGIRKLVSEDEWVMLMRAGCSTAFIRQFHILLAKPDPSAGPYAYTYEVEQDGIFGGLLRLQEAGVDEEWARRYKVEAMGRKLMTPSEYIDGWQNNRHSVRNWRTVSA
ncbi:hypothetical protein [Streptomyces sp. NPDC017448]|uniref:hypothetical protein n=1 Tax=Streptomyces sp. NPDC017448 TaxID=3364996 RepID=UPI00379FBFE4